MKKFTLVELLVVVAIIGILSSMLLPSLQSAREASRVSLCVSNVRQVGIGVFLAADNFDSTAGASANQWAYNQSQNTGGIDVGGTKVGWFGNVAVMLEFASSSGSHATYTSQVQSHAKMKALMCPNDNNTIPTEDLSIGGGSPASVLTSYSPNHNVFTIKNDEDFFAGGKYDTLNKPAEVLMTMDSDIIDGWNTRYLWAWGYKTLAERYNETLGGVWGEVFPQGRHMGEKMPVTLFDGHTEVIRMSSSGQMNKISVSADF